jgi:hypothetical protein
MGDQKRARDLAAATLAAKPDFTIESYVATLPYQNPADGDHLAEGLHKAGLPS